MIAPFTSLHGTTRIGARRDRRARLDADRLAVGDGARVLHSYLTGAESATGRASGRSPTCGPGPCCARARRSGRSSRSRTPTSAPAPRFPISPTSATPTSASARTSARARSPPTTTATARTARRSAHGSGRASTRCSSRPSAVGDDAFTGAGSVITEDVPAGALGVARAAPAQPRGLRGAPRRPGRGRRTAADDGGAAARE